jgi:tRNA uridine 5-carboxymethylaminomethyl modification enzyme
MSYEVVVVGLGHAGCEAALACARMGLHTAAVTLRRDGIGLMSCNPAIGGTAKGHLVRELDALGGQMARAADLSGTHFKILNASKGPAVRATRVLCDREQYARRMQAAVLEQPGLEVLEDEVERVLVAGGRVVGVGLRAGGTLRASAVVLTTGTFLRGLMHVGETQECGGRLGDGAAGALSASLQALGLELGRFKTGTPARLWRRSIDYSVCEAQPGEVQPRPFSLRTRERLGDGERFPALPQLRCHISWTNQATHQVVRENLSRSPLFIGQLEGRGPRYCPSLEDKVVRFADRARHQVFLEPEGVDSELVYPAGLSTSLPADAQLQLLRTIRGLEAVEVARFGYAVEYDYAPPTQLLPSLESRRVEGLFLAGQLNGTSGYEEAAVQGLLAGINAARRVRGAPAVVLGRQEAHAGVLVDELVSHGVDEPFRMMTARSEHRLRLREGNAELRLRERAGALGLCTPEEVEKARRRKAAITAAVARLRREGLASVLKRPQVSYPSLRAMHPGLLELEAEVAEEVEVEVKYEGYIARQARAAERERAGYEGWVIPENMEYGEILGLSVEVREKLSARRPRTLAEARRIPGVTPAACSLLAVHLRRVGGVDKVWANRGVEGTLEKTGG